MPGVINFRILRGIFCVEDMSSYPLNGDVGNQVSGWEQTPSYAPTPRNFGREPTPSVFCPSPAYTYGDPSSPSHLPALYCLGFLEDTGLNRRGTHGDTPESIAYLIEWKVAHQFLFREYIILHTVHKIDHRSLSLSEPCLS